MTLTIDLRTATAAQLQASNFKPQTCIAECCRHPDTSVLSIPCYSPCMGGHAGSTQLLSTYSELYEPLLFATLKKYIPKPILTAHQPPTVTITIQSIELSFMNVQRCDSIIVNFAVVRKINRGRGQRESSSTRRAWLRHWRVQPALPSHEHG